MGVLERVKEVLSDENLFVGSVQSFERRFEDATTVPKIRKLLEWEAPQVTDLSKILQVEKGGRVSAVRMDLYPGVNNLKKPVIAGLLLKDIMKGHIPTPMIDTLADSGNMNTGFALKYYCAKCGLRGFYIMSRFFPLDMVDMLRDERFQVLQAPRQNGKGLEEEFYGYLFNLMRKSALRKNKHCLWHAKYGGWVLRPLGREIAKNLDREPDYLVVSVGAGSTLECLCEVQSCLLKRTAKQPKIVVAEHVKSPVYSRMFPVNTPLGVPRAVEESQSLEALNPDVFRKPPSKRLPHIVIGPHYEKPNSLLSSDVPEKADHVQQFSDDEWMKMSLYLESNGLGVGNSSAAHISVATNLANQGYDVLTVIMEPMRSYYKTNP